MGGALLKVGSNLAQGKGFGSGALQGVGKAAITPGSGIGAGAELAGNLLQKADNPLAQKVGQGLDVASNFAPGGGGIAGAVGDVAGLAAGAGGGGAAGALGNLAQNVLGQARGGSIPYNPEIAGAPYRMRGVRLMKSGGINEYGDGGTIDYDNGGRPGEIPGLDVKSRETQVGGPIGRPEMAETTQIYIDGLPVSGSQAKAFVEERREGMAGQGMPGLGEALNAAEARRSRDIVNKGNREYLGGNIHRTKTAEQEFREAQRRQGASGLLGALENYDTSRGTRNYGRGGYLR